MHVDGLLEGLDDEQRHAVTTSAAPLCILAGAGSGKTRVLTRRIAHRAATGSIDPRKVLALTFTRKAARELRERLEGLGLRDLPTAGTIHAVAYAQLRTWQASRRRPVPALLERKAPLLGKLLTRGSLTAAELAGEIEWAKARLVSPEEYASSASAANRRPAASPEQVARLYRRYEDEKRSKGLVDFDDLLIGCLEAISGDATFAAAQRWRYRHLFVDEFQDVNPLQFRLLRAWLGSSTDLCVVGDPAQAIYGWNGADAGFLTNFAAHFPGSETVELRSNYRSTPQILAAASRVLGSAAEPKRNGVAARRTQGAPPSCTCHATDIDEAAAIARALRDNHAPGRSWSAQAVLVRTNAQLPVIEAALRKVRIPHLVRGGRSFTDRPEIQQALRAARRTAGPFAVWLADLEAALQASRIQLEASAESPEQPDGGGSPTVDVVASDEPGSASDRLAGLEQLVALGREFASADPTAPAYAFGDWLAAMTRGEGDDHGDAVQLVTFHAAKGLEWPIVHLAGLEDGFVPIAHARDDAAVAEERRLLHVAATRARDELHLTWAASRTFGARSVARRPSPWLRLLTGEDAVHESRPGVPAAPRRNARARARDAVSESRRLLAGSIASQPPLFGRRQDADQREAFDRLWRWRAQMARGASVSPAIVLPDKLLEALARQRPRTLEALSTVEGMTPLWAARYGEAIVAVIAGQESGSAARGAGEL